MILSIIGILAGILTSISSLPQVIKSYRSKSTKDLCIYQMLLLLAGLVLWTVYGLIKKDYVLVGANLISIVISVALLVLKIKYDRRA